jgi:aspartate/methionine/tyrosine aminotransferase
MISPSQRSLAVEEYYFSRKLAEVRALDTPDKRMINLGIGSPDQAPADAVIDALVTSARQSTHHGYQSYKGVPVFRQAIAGFMQQTYGVRVNPDTEILPLVGSKEGIMHISMAFLNEGDEVLVPDPGYPTYAAATTLAGGKVRTYRLNEARQWKIDIEDLRKQNLQHVKIMWLNSPHMPTGSVMSRGELEALVQLALENKFLLVNDNPYSLILNDTPLSLLAIPGAEQVALELNSLSKSHNMAGWRLGWVAGKQTYVDAILRVKSNMDSGMFLPLQHAAAQALHLGDEWFTRLNATYRERARAVHRLLDELNCTYTKQQSGLFVWARVPDEVVQVEAWLDELLYATHVFITPGFVFGNNGKRFIRVSLCNKTEHIEEALERIVAFRNTDYKKVSNY